MIRKILFLILTGLSGLLSEAFAGPIQAQITSQNDTIHVELTGRESWDYSLKKVSLNKKSYLQLMVEKMDPTTLEKLTAFKSPYVKSISVAKDSPSGKSTLMFELAHENVESFDYLTDQPSRLIVDFFLSPQSEKVAARPAATNKKIKKEDVTKKTETRNPASTDLLVVNPSGLSVGEGSTNEIRSGLFDGGDPNFERFTIKDYEIKEESIIKSRENYYIPFPMLEVENLNWKRVQAALPEYNIHPEDTDENKQARLLLTLFTKKRFQVYLKTLEWFKQKYENSKFEEIITFMTGDVYLALWKDKGRLTDFDMAIEKYKEAVRKFPKSVLAERTSLSIGYLQFERGDKLAAIKFLNEHIAKNEFGGSHVFSKDLARMGVYQSYFSLNKFNEAFETLDDIEKNSPHQDMKVEAAYRKGDIYVRSGNFTRAIEEYQRALKSYPQGESRFPNAYFNQAESLFLLDKYRQSLDVFREFAKKFPSDGHAPFALTRLGELLEILGADKSRVVGAFLETYFRYGESPAAIIARLRLLSARMKGMKEKDADVTIKEILSLARKLEIGNVQQFATVMIADGYNQRGDHQKALDLLIKYFQENPGSADDKQIKRRIVANINDKMRNEINRGDIITGLKTHQKYADNWLKGSDRLDTYYYVGRAFEVGGALQSAEKYYQNVLNDYYAALNTDRQKVLSVQEHLPSIDSLNLRLAAVTFDQNKMSRSYDYLKNIKTPEKMSEDEQIERVSLAAKLLDKRGDYDSAIRYLTEILKNWQGVPSRLVAPYFELAEYELKAGRREDAKKSYIKVDYLVRDSGLSSETLHSAALEKLAQLYFEDKEIDKCIATYRDLLEKYEERKPLSSIRYKLGKIYFDRGDIQKAADVWGQFKNDKFGTWEQLAKEELKGVEWQADYKKYLKRIPAMAGKGP